MKYKQSYGDKQRDEQKRAKTAVSQGPAKEQPAAEPTDRTAPPKLKEKKAH